MGDKRHREDSPVVVVRPGRPAFRVGPHHDKHLAHLHWFRRLPIHWEIRDDIHEAFLTPRVRAHLLTTPEGIA
jgi:hypothetical protein